MPGKSRSAMSRAGVLVSICLALPAVAGCVQQGYIDRNGAMVIEPQFDNAGCFSEGLAYVEVGEKYGYIDKKGKIAVKPQFDFAWDFSEGLAGVKLGEKSGYIDKSGKYVVPLAD